MPSQIGTRRAYLLDLDQPLLDELDAALAALPDNRVATLLTLAASQATYLPHLAGDYRLTVGEDGISLIEDATFRTTPLAFKADQQHNVVKVATGREKE